MHIVAGEGVAGINRRHRDLSIDGVRNFMTVSRRGRLKEDLESSMWRQRLAIHSACHLASCRGWYHAIVESDSQVAISFSSSETVPPWSIAALVADSHLWSKNMDLSFSWTSRDNNKVAHCVARLASSFTFPFSRDVSLPHELTLLARRCETDATVVEDHTHSRSVMTNLWEDLKKKKQTTPTADIEEADIEETTTFIDLIKEVKINVSLVDVLAGMPNYEKFLKDLVSNKSKMEQIYATFLNEELFAIIQNKLPPKLGDPGSVLIPCTLVNSVIKFRRRRHHLVLPPPLPISCAVTTTSLHCLGGFGWLF
nr:reverse transcriptase domain-containing protein [Tanacetum cinerariifolium]